LYSIAICRRSPQLAATIFDAPQALQTARANIAAENLSDRMQNWRTSATPMLALQVSSVPASGERVTSAR
jgi:hypothetical protein